MRRRRDQHLVSILVSKGPDAFTLMVEPEGMSYDFPGAERVLLTFRGPGAMRFELSCFPGGVGVWRPADTEVWAATTGDQRPVQIGGFADNPAPSLDSAAPKLGVPVEEWDHLPLPPVEP